MSRDSQFRRANGVIATKTRDHVAFRRPASANAVLKFSAQAPKPNTHCSLGSVQGHQAPEVRVRGCHQDAKPLTQSAIEAALFVRISRCDSARASWGRVVLLQTKMIFNINLRSLGKYVYSRFPNWAGNRLARKSPPGGSPGRSRCAKVCRALLVFAGKS